MLRLGLVGASIHAAPLELLSALTLPREGRSEALRELARQCGFNELVYVATCNRVEFVFQTESEQSLQRSRNRLLDFFLKSKSHLRFQPENFYVAGGSDAARHLFCVASALDSLVIGESQVLGQIREAYAEAEQAGLVKEELRRVFQAAFHCAKKVRRQTAIGTKHVSIVNLAAAGLRDFVANRRGLKAALIGVGPMTAKLAATLRGFGVEQLYFVNRTTRKAIDLAAQWGGEALPLQEFLTQPPCVDVVCTATAAPNALFGCEETERLLSAGDVNRPFLYVDLAVPRDVVDDVIGIQNVRVCHLGTLRSQSQVNRRERFRAADRATEIVAEEVARFQRQVVESTLAPLFRAKQEEARRFAESGLATLFAGKLEHLASTDRQAIRYWVMNKLVPNILHMPMKAIVDHSAPEQRCSSDAETRGGELRVDGVRLAPPRC